jgi:hypothetical protein
LDHLVVDSHERCVTRSNSSTGSENIRNRKSYPNQMTKNWWRTGIWCDDTAVFARAFCWI